MSTSLCETIRKVGDLLRSLSNSLQKVTEINSGISSLMEEVRLEVHQRKEKKLFRSTNDLIKEFLKSTKMNENMIKKLEDVEDRIQVFGATMSDTNPQVSAELEVILYLLESAFRQSRLGISTGNQQKISALSTITKLLDSRSSNSETNLPEPPKLENRCTSFPSSDPPLSSPVPPSSFSSFPVSHLTPPDIQKPSSSTPSSTSSSPFQTPPSLSWNFTSPMNSPSSPDFRCRSPPLTPPPGLAVLFPTTYPPPPQPPPVQSLSPSPESSSLDSSTSFSPPSPTSEIPSPRTNDCSTESLLAKDESPTRDELNDLDSPRSEITTKWANSEKPSVMHRSLRSKTLSPQVSGVRRSSPRPSWGTTKPFDWSKAPPPILSDSPPSPTDPPTKHANSDPTLPPSPTAADSQGSNSAPTLPPSPTEELTDRKSPSLTPSPVRSTRASSLSPHRSARKNRSSGSCILSKHGTTDQQKLTTEPEQRKEKAHCKIDKRDECLSTCRPQSSIDRERRTTSSDQLKRQSMQSLQSLKEARNDICRISKHSSDHQLREKDSTDTDKLNRSAGSTSYDLTELCPFNMSNISLPDLIASLTGGILRDNPSRQAFFVNYSAHFPSKKILELLKERFASSEESTGKVQSSVIVLLNYWIEHQSKDLFESLDEFISLIEVMQQHHKKGADILLSKFQQKKKQTIFSSIGSTKGTLLRFRHPVSLEWNKFDEEELALAITFHDAELFSLITPKQLLYWNSKLKPTHCSEIHEAIGFSNKLSNWVTSELVKKVRLQDRIHLFEKMVTLGEHLFALKNFSSCFALIGGLSNSAFWRMKKTRHGANSDITASLEKLTTIMTHRSNYSAYRTYLKGLSPPCVPYLGVVLSDLTFIDDGNQDAKGDFVNFTKWKMVSKVVSNFLFLQTPTYREVFSAPSGSFEAAITNYKFLTSDEALKYSKLVEPEDDSDEAMERLLRMHEEAQNRIAVLEEQIQKSQDVNKEWKLFVGE